LLAVGVSKYLRKDYELGFPAKDARDFANAMLKQENREYGVVIAKVLADARATRSAVLSCLTWLSDVSEKDDVVILFLAGHGISEDTGQYYFMGYDAEPERIEETGIGERDLRDSLRRVRGKAVFFVDTCFAGKVIGDARIARKELARLADTLSSAENGVVVFAASSGRQLSQESDAWGNGAFTKALVEGLSGAADILKKGRVTFLGLAYFISEAVRQLTNGKQTPVLIPPFGVPDFALALTKP